MATDPAIRDHQTWLGYLQPDGLVVSPAALVDSQVAVNAHTIPLQQRFLTFVEESDHQDSEILAIRDLGVFLRGFLDWPPEHLVGKGCPEPMPEELKAPLREFGETLEPDLAFRDPKRLDPEQPWLLLVQDLPLGTDLDVPVESAEAGWAASPTRRFERLLREVAVPIGLIGNRTHLRLLYAPRGENAGTLTFPVAAMSEVAGRPILAAFEMLLSRYRLLAAPSEAYLPALLKRSRDYQSRVSTALSRQVLNSLYELLRGFQAADGHSHGDLLHQVLAEHPDQIYNGLLTVLMRLVFLLYAEDRGLMPGSDLYVRNYAVHGLFERLRADAQQFPDTMDHRYGAWAQLLALFRSVHDGCEHKSLKLPARHGHLFDPERFPFLEGGTIDEGRLPLVADGVTHRVLENLLLLDGERLSYRTLDVEQIGSVYETMMGFRLELAKGQTIALRPGKKAGAPVPISLARLLETVPKDRAKWIKERTDYKLTATMTKATKAAESVDGLLAALERRIARNATPHPVPPGTMVLVPTDERRRTGSHYTPRSLTEPIVRKTLGPILKQLGDQPTPDQVLGLKVCDPAMGSGAFLVEACRQLADELVKAWASHGWKPFIPPDEDEVLHARRIVAQRCLYGVDRNPMAVDLAKLSLWLTTLAREHPFTFLDHSLRAGDSLVGLTQRQIAGFHWAPNKQISFLESRIRERLEVVSRERRQILDSGDQMPPAAKRQKLQVADDTLNIVRMLGDAVVSAFFHGDKKTAREERLGELFAKAEEHYVGNQFAAVVNIQKAVGALRAGEHPISPFHWEVEFPEVFAPDRAGFDAIVGNPPFLGGNQISTHHGMEYFAWLSSQFPGAGGICDLVTYFFRQAYALLNDGGTFGLIATKTVGKGETRTGGLAWIRQRGGVVFAATRRKPWPGEAAVIVSIVHVIRRALPQKPSPPAALDGTIVSEITSYLFHGGGDAAPARLLNMAPLFSQGTNPRGRGFIFADGDEASTPLAEYRRIVRESPHEAARIRPYLGGEEINQTPAQSPHRHIICVDDLHSERELRAFPNLYRIICDKVRPERMALSDNPNNDKLKRRWWSFHADRTHFYHRIRKKKRVLVNTQVSNKVIFTFQPTARVFALTLNIYDLDICSAFAVLQSRLHAVWAGFFGSCMKDDLRYTPSTCFETFPLPVDFEANAALETTGQAYYEFRADLMVRNDEGLTKTYNRFHDPNETSSDILELRELHTAMDRTVLDAYGWTDLQPACEFLLDYEEEEDEESASRRKKPWRYRWPEEIHDEVLARLLDLNAERAEEERRAGLAAAAAEAKKAKPKRGRKKKPELKSPRLPGMLEEPDDE